MDSNMDKEYSIMRMEISILDSILMECLRGLVSTLGLIHLATEEILSKDIEMAMGFGLK